MTIKYGKGKTQYGPGISIKLKSYEVAIAIDAYLVSHRIYVSGPRTITIDNKLCGNGEIYVDPSGFVINSKGNKLSGRGKNKS